ncbi:MAG: hypothetical protein COA50_11165 [Flavobacteriaceae bacterium]|nr:MAG: hypothetical protein COA50_11165 [Flavobacteriaceae bacterium]
MNDCQNLKLKMNKKRRKIYTAFALMGLLFFIDGCVEPIEPETITFQSALVIDATITNEMKQQQLFLSRTFTFEEDGPQAESNAVIKVMSDQGEYVFEETSPGTYKSTLAFAAEPNNNYQLMITTNDGRTYVSDTEQLTNTTAIDDLYVERITNDDGVDGMAIFVDSFDATGASKHYRYEYEETYKIIAPKWSSKKLIAPTGPDLAACHVETIAKEEEQQPCYATDFSNEIIVTNTNEFIEDRVSRFPVRFIKRDNYIMSHRYSILVKQYVQSGSAYTFFETLQDFSGSESLFSQTQPGFLKGNISSVENVDEKVLGYFDVSSVSERRVYFDYDAFFPGEPLPPYIEPCVEIAPPLSKGAPPVCVLSTQVEFNLVSYYNENMEPDASEGPFIVVPKVCGYCTEIGSKLVPEFWEE